MRASRLRTWWIIFLSIFYTGSTCIQSVLKNAFGNPSRPWVDGKIHVWSRKLLELVSVTYKVVNPHQVQPQSGQPTIIMCNHSSLYDIPLSMETFPNHSIRMLAKKELSQIPLMGKGMRAAEFPFVDRKNRLQAIKDLEAVKKLLESGIIMWIAPEGTRSKNGKLGSFKKGAFITAIQAKATIIPIGIRGAYDILPARTHQYNIHQKAEIHIGKPINAADFTIEDKDALINQTFLVMKDLVGEKK